MTKEELIEALLVIELGARTQRNSLEKNCSDDLTFKILNKFINLIDGKLSHIKEIIDGQK